MWVPDWHPCVFSVAALAIMSHLRTSGGTMQNWDCVYNLTQEDHIQAQHILKPVKGVRRALDCFSNLRVSATQNN